MFIRHITITGVDERTDLHQLKALSRQFFKVEWGFLYSSTRSVKEPRYMETKKMLESAAWLHGSGCKTSLHLCGHAVNDFINFPEFSINLKHFDRVQLNFNSSKSKIKLSDLATAMQTWPEIQFIIQYNRNNEYTVQALYDIPNLAILCDSSGGRGIEITNFKKPLAGVFTGYAGGIGPGNIRKVKSKIANLGPGVCWIDMESNVRTNDWLDLDKVTKVLK